MNKEELKDFILKKEEEGKVVIQTIEGLAEINLDEFIKQPIEGLLYDLNRDKVTVLTYIDDPKWVNDYAVGLVIAKSRIKIKQLEDVLKEIKEYINNIDFARDEYINEIIIMDILQKVPEDK